MDKPLPYLKYIGIGKVNSDNSVSITIEYIKPNKENLCFIISNALQKIAYDGKRYANLKWHHNKYVIMEWKLCNSVMMSEFNKIIETEIMTN